MKKFQFVSNSVFFLASLCLQLAWAAQEGETDAMALQARIARVEQGLTTRIVIKGAPHQKMGLSQRMAFYQVPALSIALINQGHVEWVRAYGMADVERQLAATTSTLFQAGSVSKSLSAMGALALVEQGKLTLDADVNLRLKSWQIPRNEFNQNKAVSLRMLLNHSAGMTVHGYQGYMPGATLPTLQQTLDGIAPANSAPIRVDRVPGSVWRYSGGGYSIVQLLMEDVSGQTFADYMDSAVLKRLEMKQSSFATELPLSWHALMATAYDGAGKAIAGQRHVYPESAAAGLWTTPGDLARVILEVQQAIAGQSSKILTPKMTETMLTRGLGEYGLGYFVEDLGDRISFSHSGGTEGFRSQLYAYTRTGQGAVIMTNSESGAALIDEILYSIAAEYGWPEFQVTEKLAIPGDAIINHQLAGDYQLLNLPAHIVAEGDRLFFQSKLFGAQRMELFAESKAVFFATAQDMTFRFERGDGGVVQGFSLIRGASTFPASRNKVQ